MMKRRRLVLAASAILIAVGSIYGCSEDKPPPAGQPTGNPEGGGTDRNVAADQNTQQETGSETSVKRVAVASIQPTSDASVVTGTATFTEENGEVTVVINITAGFPPGGSGLRGMHIHTNASCAANDAGVDGATLFGGAAGGHWNPADASHGLPTSASHHLGDMGNILITDAGTGTLTLVSKEWTVAPGGTSVVGHSVIFHQQQDDGVSQPVGNAGARPGCGLIVLQ